MKMNELAGKYGKYAASIIGLAAIFMWAAGSCTSKVGDNTPGHRAAAVTSIADGQLHVARSESLPAPVEIVGTVTSEDRIRLAAKLGAEVKQVFVTAGSAVKKGQILVELDNREAIEQLSAAEAQFAQAESEYNRTKQLIEKEAATKQALTAAESSYRTAKAQLERAKVMLSYTTITSPIDGIITDRLVEPGDLAGQGQAVAGVYDPSKMRLDAPVPARLVDKVKIGQEVTVSIDRPALVIKGKVSHIVSEVDPASRTQTVKVTLDKTAQPVLPGTFGRITIQDDPRKAIVLPASCVFRTGQLEYVQVFSGTIENRLIKAGPERDGSIEILSGISDGERVLLVPAAGGPHK